MHLEPTHQVVRLAREAGFDNVHDYLVHIVTRESVDTRSCIDVAVLVCPTCTRRHCYNNMQPGSRCRIIPADESAETIRGRKRSFAWGKWLDCAARNDDNTSDGALQDDISVLDQKVRVCERGREGEAE
jgi:hypothetical protein